MAKTPNYGLTTYTLNDDFRFVDYRMAEAGSGAESPSNMEIIDTQLKAVSDKVDETATDISNNYLPLAGGTMTGPIQMNTPSGYKVFIHPKASNTDNGWRLLAQSSDGTWGNGILTLNGSTGKWSLGECNADGWIDVQPANCGMKWTTNDGTIYYVKCYKPNNMFQITKKVGDAAETSVLSIYKDSATFVGNASTATSATKATQDASGNTITSSYGASINTSGNNIRLMSKSGAQLSSITVPYATNSGTSSSCSGNAATATRAQGASNARFLLQGDGYIENPGNRIMYFATNTESGKRLMYGVLSAWSLAPEYSENTDLGSSGNKWLTVWSITPQISTSDRNKKENINDIGDKYLQLFDKLNPVSYKLKNEKSTQEDGHIHDRIHTGFIAQDIEDAMNEIGIDSKEFGGFCKDRRITKVQVINETIIKDDDVDILGTENSLGYGEIPVSEDDPTPYEYSLRYAEFIPLNTAAIKRAEKKIQEQQTEINELKSALQALTEKVNQLSKG